MPDNLQLSPAAGQDHRTGVNKPTQERRLGTSAFHPLRPANWPETMTAVGANRKLPTWLPSFRSAPRAAARRSAGSRPSSVRA